VLPVMEGGELRGYRMEPGSDPQLFNELGLRAGDIVTEVNGLPLANPALMGQVINQLSSAPQLNVVVNRNGTLENLSLNLR
jgi:general secretion pathway protein C